MRKLSFLIVLLSIIISTSAYSSPKSYTGRTIDVADGEGARTAIISMVVIIVSSTKK